MKTFPADPPPTCQWRRDRCRFLWSVTSALKLGGIGEGCAVSDDFAFSSAVRRRELTEPIYHFPGIRLVQLLPFFEESLEAIHYHGFFGGP